MSMNEKPVPDLCRQCLRCGGEEDSASMTVWRDADGSGHWVHPLCAADRDRMACEWSDYRKDYGTKDVHREHQAFKAGWEAALGKSLEPGVLR